MKNALIISVLLSIATMSAMAIPAKRGQWRDITLADGTTVRVEVVGDEHGHYFIAEDGSTYQMQDNRFVRSELTQLIDNAKARSIESSLRRATRMRKVASHAKKSVGEYNTSIGERKGLVILVEFKDVKFKSQNLTRYQDYFNALNYVTNDGFVGSVRDYFIAQSDSLFDLTFDVIGPVSLSKNMKYYGENDAKGNDKHPVDMVIEGCKAIDSLVNFADYDWDGDGEVDQVYVLYAGYGESDNSYNMPNTIWPHEWCISADGKNLTLDNVAIETYACGSELAAGGKIDGIGTVCHEFSHCLGFPDTYDTGGSGNMGMGEWDVMCMGSYNGNGNCPPNYTAYQKSCIGWLNLIELTNDTLITDLKPVAKGGQAYVLYNSGYHDEFFVIENRQKNGWDKHIPGKGLMINYVDYDELLWEYNLVNAVGNLAEMYGLNPGNEGYDLLNTTNDHQRTTIFRANNKMSSYSSSNDLYPYRTNNCLTPTSKPASKLYHKNALGTMFMDLSIVGITQNDDGTMSFRTVAEQNKPDAITTPDVHSVPTGIYTLDGRYAGTDIKALKHGLYIVNGRKVIK